MARTRHIGVLLVVATLLLWGSAAAATTSLSTGGGAVDTASTAQVQQQEENASVTFEDQTAENGTVTVANVTVPEGGYVTIHNDSLQDGQAVSSVIGVSDYLEPGTHENVTVTLYEDVPGANFENATAPNGTETLFAMAHMETSTEMAGNETTTTTEVGANDTETTTEDGLNDTETTTEAGANDTETTTEAGANDTETTTTEAGANDTETTTTEAGANDTQATNQTYDFVTSDGQEDGPYVVDGAAVTNSAEVEFAAPAADGGAGGAGTNDTQANETQGESAFVVESIEAPSLAASNASITVNATISNSADEERSEDVAFRLAGGDADVVVHQNVTVDASGNETVTFELNASDVGAGEYIHGVTTENSSKFATIEVTDDAQVVFGDQAVDGENVTVESVYLPEGGYVALHDASLLGGDAVGSVVGASEYLEPGVHENVTVTLSESAAAQGNQGQGQGQGQSGQSLVAMAHMETTDDESFDFVESDGEDDGPYTVDGEAVVDAGNLTVALENTPSGSDEDPGDN